MNRKTRIYWITLLLLSSCVWAGDSPTESEAQFESLPQYLAHLDRTFAEARASGRISDEDMRVIDRMRDPSVTVAECDRLAIGLIRRHFARDPNVYEQQEIQNEAGYVIAGVPYALFVYKGSMAGAYEYTRLCGGHVLFEPYAGLCPPEKKQEILRYRLYVIVSRFNATNLNMFVFQQTKYDVPLRVLAHVRSEYGDSAMLRAFLLAYPFEHNSYLNIKLRQAPAWRGPQSGEELFFEYMTTLLPIAEQRLDFLRTMARRSTEIYPGMLMYVVQHDPMLAENAQYVTGLFALAMDSRQWEAGMELLSNPAAVTKAKQFMEYASHELERVETERAVLSTLMRAIEEASRN